MVAACQCERRRVTGNSDLRASVVECSGIPLQLTPFRVEQPAIDRWLASATQTVCDCQKFRWGSRRDFTRPTCCIRRRTGRRPFRATAGFKRRYTTGSMTSSRYFPDERSLRRLSSLGVNFIVVHADMFDPRQWQDVDRIASAICSLALACPPGERRTRLLSALAYVQSGQVADRGAKLLAKSPSTNCDFGDESVIAVMRHGEKNAEEPAATDAAQTLL